MRADFELRIRALSKDRPDGVLRARGPLQCHANENRMRALR